MVNAQNIKKKATFYERIKRHDDEYFAIHEQGIKKYIQSETEKRENALVSSGASLPEQIDGDMNFNENRQLEIDRLVEEYNSKGEDKLKSYEEIEKEAIGLVNKNKRADFSTDGVADWSKEVAAGMYSYVKNHKLQTLFAVAGFACIEAGLAYQGVRAAVSWLSAEALVNGAINYKDVSKKKETADVLSEEAKANVGLNDVNVTRDTIAGTAKDVLAVAVVGGAIKGATLIGKSMLKGVTGSVKRTSSPIGRSLSEATSGVSDDGYKAFSRNISRISENASPDERAFFVSEMKGANPSSVISYESRINLEKDISEYFDAVIAKDADKVKEVLSRPSAPIVPDKVISDVDDMILESSGFRSNKFMESEVSKTMNGIGLSDQRIAMKKENLFAFEELIKSEPVDTLFDRYTSDMFPGLTKHSTSEDSILKSYKNAFVELSNNNVSPKFGGFTDMDLRSFHNPAQREAVLNFNTALKRAELTESLVSSVSSRKNPSTNTMVAAVGNYLEKVDTSVASSLMRGVDDMADAISVATKSQAKNLDVAEFFDVVTGKSQGTRMLGIKNAWDKMTDNINKLGIESGVEIKKDSSYFPNRWVFSKMSGKETEFVSDMLQAVDKEAMSKLTKREVNEEFFSKMYEGIKNNDSKISSRVVVLKDGASWKSMHEKYGRISTVDEVVSLVNNSSKNTIVNHIRGANDYKFIREQINSVKNAIFENKSSHYKKIGGSPSERFVNSVIKSADHLSDIMGNKIGDPTEYMGTFMKNLTSVYTKAKLSKAAMTAYFSDRWGTMPNAFRGIGVKNPNLTSIFGVMDGYTKKELRDLYNISFNFSRDVSARVKDVSQFSRAKSLAVNSLKKGYDAPQKALSWVVDTNEMFAMKTFGVEVANKTHLPFDKINSKMNKFLTESGFTDKHWEILRGIPQHRIGPDKSTSLITSNMINRMMDSGFFDPKDLSLVREVRNKLSTAEQSFALLSAPRSTIVGRGSNVIAKNFATQIAATPINMFLNIKNSMFVYAAREATERFGATSVVPNLLIASIVGTAASQFSTTGKFRFDKHTAVRVAANTAFLGAGDIFLEELLGVRYETDMQKTIDVGKRLFSGDLFGGLHKLSTIVNPYSNLTLLGAMASNYVLDSAFAVLDPKGAEAFDKQLRKNMRNGYISEIAYKARKPKK